MFKSVVLVWLTVCFAVVSPLAEGEEQAQKLEQTPRQITASYFGPQLLSEEEQVAYRARIRAAKTAQESEAIRAEHYELMKVRAREKGVALPERRPPVGGSLGNIFGPQLMTEEERAAYRARLRSAKTQELSERIRTENRNELELRAQEKGVLRPETSTAVSGQDAGGADSLPAIPGKNAGAAGGAAGVAASSAGVAVSNSGVAGNNAGAKGGNAGVAVSGAGVMSAFFGPQLMTEEEQMAYRARLRAAGTPQEREKIRDDHRRQLQSRARERGVALPQ